MHKKTILASAILAGALALPALAGQPVTAPAAPAPQTCPLHGSVSLGYVNQYEYRGMVLTSDFAENGGLVYGANLYYQTPYEGIKLVADFTFRDMQVGSPYTGGVSKQTNLFVGAEKSFLGDTVTTTFGYNFVRGGLPGLAAAWDDQGKSSLVGDGPMSSNNEDQQHELLSVTKVNFGEWIGAKGLFYQLSAAYAFSGNVGWWLGNTVGYEGRINDCVKYVAAVNASSSYSYWMNGTDGWDQVNVSLALPITPKGCESFEIAPYMSLNWGAANAQNINRVVAGERNQYGVSELFENFAIVAGVKATYNF